MERKKNRIKAERRYHDLTLFRGDVCRHLGSYVRILEILDSVGIVDHLIGILRLGLCRIDVVKEHRHIGCIKCREGRRIVAHLGHLACALLAHIVCAHTAELVIEVELRK